MTVFGAVRFDYDEVTSTQDIARELALQGAVPGTVVTAQAMTAGRGRLGRTWHVPPGKNVCLTAVGSSVAADVAWQLAMVAGLCVAEAVASAGGVEPQVRFPNDVYLQGRKLAGVLVESVPDRSARGRLIPLVGIGVNVLKPEEALPSEVASRAVVLEEVSGRVLSVGAVEAALLERMTFWFAAWEREGFAGMLERCRELGLRETRRLFFLEGAEQLCRVAEVSGEGRVLLELPDGSFREVRAAQVVLGGG